ncbi:serine--tRNA ligase [Candidatus Woesearchaeota archaeon]|nr:serine--tRNA ligase [Candidatus Woesearchaeota archaeon]
MLDINFIRDNKEEVKKNIRRRGEKYNPKLVDELLDFDKEWRELKGKIDNLRHERNEITLQITKLSKEKKDISKFIDKARGLPQEIKNNEERLDELKKKINYSLMTLPNILHESVPYGESDQDNKIVGIFGSKKKLKFKPLSHVDLVEKNDWVDLERAAKISGARWYFLKGELALLEQALVRYGMDFMAKRKYILVVPPFMMNRRAYEGVTDLGAFGEMLYKIEGEDLYQIATSEHPITAMYMNEVLDAKKLPMKLFGYSTNFRKEAGAHGKDMKGIFRVHQFNKVEQLIFSRPDQSWKLHEELIKNAIDFFKSLNLHFRQVNVCTGDIGIVAAKKYDLDVWYPVQEAYREVVSCSNCTSYQAVRLGIKYNAEDHNEYIHTLNSTLVATSRALVAILENYQQKDGSVVVPKVLRKYMNGIKVIGKKEVKPKKKQVKNEKKKPKIGGKNE